MRRLFLIVIATLFLVPGVVHATDTCTTDTSCSNSDGCPVLIGNMQGCRTISHRYENDRHADIRSCDVCNAGTRTLLENISVSLNHCFADLYECNCTNDSDCGDTTKYKCVDADNTGLSGGQSSAKKCVCRGCGTIQEDWSDWTDVSGQTGLQHRYKETCSCSTKSTQEQYRCAAGYYGESPNASNNTCTRCPVVDGVYTDPARTSAAYGVSNAGATTIFGCYLDNGTYYNESGTFTSGGTTCVAPDLDENGNVSSVSSNSWCVAFSYGTFCGNAYCRTETSLSSKPGPDTSGGNARFCWCTTPYSDSAYGYLAPYYDGTCSTNCAHDCAYAVAEKDAWRSKLLK